LESRERFLRGIMRYALLIVLISSGLTVDCIIPEPGRSWNSPAPKEKAAIRLRFSVACPPVPWHPVYKGVRR
jgi:hypothetical protein